mgnify:CR=1 FL=1
MKLLYNKKFSNIYEKNNTIHKSVKVYSIPDLKDLWHITYKKRYCNNENFVNVLKTYNQYLIMEKIEGPTLEEYLKSSKFNDLSLLTKNNIIKKIIKSYKKITSDIVLKPIKVIVDDKCYKYIFYHDNLDGFDNYIINNKYELVLIDPNAFNFFNIENIDEMHNLERCKWKRDQTLYKLNKLLS